MKYHTFLAILSFMLLITTTLQSADYTELEEARFLLLLGDKLTYSSLKNVMERHENKIMPAMIYSLEVDLGGLMRFMQSTENVEIVNSMKIILGHYNDELSHMIMAAQKKFGKDHILTLMLLLSEMPISDKNRFDVLDFIKKNYSEAEIESRKSTILMYKAEMSPPPSDDFSVFAINMYIERYKKTIEIMDLLLKGENEDAKLFIKNQINFVQLQIEMMTSRIPSLVCDTDSVFN